MTGPRNRRDFERALARREQIRALLLDHAKRNPLARSPSGKTLQQQLREQYGQRLGLSAIYRHVDAIRIEALMKPLTLESFQCIE